MPPVPPSLDAETLIRLRELVTSMHRQQGTSIPVDQLVRMAEDVRLDVGVTIDFEASRSLGQPMVVLRMPAEPAPRLEGLSKREREIADLIADGLSNKQIAGRLFLSLATVKDHVHRILVKTGLSNRAAVAAACLGHSVSDQGPTAALQPAPGNLDGLGSS
ncbi:MAG: helix-turn-helix transcriptional regulator [Phycisphaerales bacterium]|nr:helix-turn-helix transcriptional regulator [Phycisphaerales bacterium]